MTRNWKALLLYAVLTVIFTWPLLPNITTHFPTTFLTEGGDPDMYIWFMDVAAHRLMDSSFHPSQTFFYPSGMDLTSGFEAPIILAVSTPVIILTHNPILAYNIVLLLAFIFTAYTCYLLIYYLTKSYSAALVAGYSFGFSTYMMVRGTQHIDLLLLFTVCLVVYFALKFLDQPNKRNTIFFGPVCFNYSAFSLVLPGWLRNVFRFTMAV